MTIIREERLQPYITDTLNGAINGSETTITVTNGSKFDAVGDYRILIDSELMQVTSRSGNVLTVTRGVEGTTGAAHSDAAVVTVVYTPAAMEDWIDGKINNFTNRKAAMRMEDISGNIMTESSWTWHNQGTATASDDGKGGIFMTLPSEGSHQVRGKRIAAPSTPYRVDAFCEFGVGAIEGTSAPNGSNIGLFLRESSTGKLVMMTWRLGHNIAMWNMNSNTSFNSNVDSAYDASSLGKLWLTIEDNGTNILGRCSIDGVNFINLWNDPRTAFLTGGANQVGFFAQSGNAAAGAYYHFHALRFS